MEQSLTNFEPSSSNTENILGNSCFSEQIIYRNLSLGAYDGLCTMEQPVSTPISLIVMQTENNWDIYISVSTTLSNHRSDKNAHKMEFFYDDLPDIRNLAVSHR